MPAGSWNCRRNALAFRYWSTDALRTFVKSLLLRQLAHFEGGKLEQRHFRSARRSPADGRRRGRDRSARCEHVLAQRRPCSAYSPAARFDLAVSEVELRPNSAGRMLMARIYQPKGPGPFPTVLDLHGGAWNRKDRFAEEPMDRALASSGLLVVAVDLTVAPEAPYPACVQDANFAVRWLKVK